MTSDPNDRLEDQPEAQADEASRTEPQSPENGSEQAERRKILIGSQRDPDAYRPKPRRDWEPVVEKKPEEESPKQQAPKDPEPEQGEKSGKPPK